MSHMRKFLLLLLVTAGCLFMLTACHGSRGLDAFVIPEEFDTSRDYEITFWAKNDTNKTQTAIYEQAIDDLILEALHEHNAGNLDRAISIYTEILTSKPVPPAPVLTVMFKHRGMAYFAKNDFDSALADFKKSFENDKRNFRSLYYAGIVYSIRGDYEQAIEVFTESLKVNEYQSHTLYRRALAYYHTGNYEKALVDLTDSEKLGLDNDETKDLHKKLIEKFDMNV